jgi:hypothetical protein
VANAAIVGPKIIATAIIAAAVTIGSLVKAKKPKAHFAIAKAMTVKSIAMTRAKKLIAKSLIEEAAFFSVILDQVSTPLLIIYMTCAAIVFQLKRIGKALECRHGALY